MNRLTVVVLIVFCVITVPLGVVAISWGCTRSAACVSTTQLVAQALGAFLVLGVLGSYAWSALGLAGSEEG